MNKFFYSFFRTYCLPILIFSVIISLPASILAQQTVRVTGTVVDAVTGDVIPGANIVQAGTTVGTIANADGNFEITVQENATLIVTFMGYTTRNVVVPGGVQTFRIDVQLEEDANRLEELVVIGYGTQRRSELTASVAMLTEEQFNTTPASGNVLELARGRIPGLIITNVNGTDPRSEVATGMRGNSSMRGGNEPLVVVDGVPGGSLTLIPPEDVASISVLRDASAAAIYGTRGNNGVILITTKRGRTGGELRATFEYSGYMTHEYIYRRANMMDAKDWREFINSDLSNSNRVDFGDDVDLMGMLTNNGNISQVHNFSLRGGSPKTNYRASVFYRGFDPIAIESDQTTWGTRIVVNHLGLNDRLDVQMSANVSFRNRNHVGRTNEWEQAAQWNPTRPVKNENGAWIEPTTWDSHNPMRRYDTMEDYSNRMTVMLSQRSSFRIIDGLNFALMTSWQQYNQTRNQHFQMDSRTSVNDVGGRGRAQKWSEQNIHQAIEFTLDYSTVLNNIHSINVIAGHGYEYTVQEQFDAWNSLFVSDGFLYNNLGAGAGRSQAGDSRSNMGSRKWDWRLASFFGRVNYTLMDKYLLSVTMRADGSSRFGPNERWGNFPAFSAGWILSREDFMRSLDIFDFLKVRGSYGITGNLPGNPSDYQHFYLWMTTYATGGMYPSEGYGTFEQTYGLDRNPNPDLKWEEKREFNFGVDFAVLNSRISGTIDIYHRKTVGLIDQYIAPMPPYVRDNIWANVGTMSNRGIEVGISAEALKRNDFRWDFDVAFNWQKNILDSYSNEFYTGRVRTFAGLAPGGLGDAIRTEEGKPTGAFYGKRFAGFTQPQPDGTGGGRWLFYNRNDEVVRLAEITAEDHTYIGNGTPKFNASLNNVFRYKRFDLTVFLRGKFGFQILNVADMYFGNRNWAANVSRSAVTTHRELDDQYQYSDYYLEPGSFVKLDNVTLGYNFNVSNIEWLSRLRVYVSGNNLHTFTKYSGLTPEIRDTGLEPGLDYRGFFPVSSTIMFGTNITF